MAAPQMRDQLRGWVPWWLSDRKYSSGKTVGFRILWVLMAVLDACAEWILQGLRAAWPGVGTPTALPYIGRSRGILRGQADTDDTFAAKLIIWLSKWEAAGSQRQLAIELHEYLGNSPMIRIVNRAGFWTTVAANGTITTDQEIFDWDSVSHPDRAGFWSDMWIIVYPTQWALRAGGSVAALSADDGLALGHVATRVAVDEIVGLVAQWKAAHSRVRAIIWTSDASLFDPGTPASLPDGTWGAWGGTGSGSRVVGGRNLTTCRYWEPR